MTPRPRCHVEGCDRFAGEPGSGLGYCGKHYLRLKRRGTTDDPPPRRNQRTEPCSAPGCDNLARTKQLCAKHYSRLLRHGAIEVRFPGRVVDGKKVCRRCGEDKPLAEYSRPNDPCRPCVAAAMRERRATTPTPLKPRTPTDCHWCGAIFMGNAKQWKYCSRECFKAGVRAGDAMRMARRRAHIREIGTEPIDRLAVFERDGWTCGLCCEPIDRALLWPDPGSPSLDHVVPIARGGMHTLDNVQAAHLGCNARKGARLIA